MKFFQFIAFAGFSVALSATASAQFSVGGAGSAIPVSGSGGGGGFPTVLPPAPGTSTADVQVAVTNIDSIVIDGLSHSWIGDTQATLTDPAGIQHLIFVRPGTTAGGSAGNSGNFTGGTYSFFESGFTDLPSAGNATPGSYNQSFSTGAGFTWTSGDAGVLNTPLSAISGPAGLWTLSIYDWAAGDTGAFTGWTLNGNSGGGGTDNTGAAFCFGDGTGATCPCSAFGATGAGCLTTSGTGMTLVGSGNADVANDSLVLSLSGGPANKPGIFFQGPNVLGFPAGDGILCSNSNLRYSVTVLDGTGSGSGSGFGVNTSSGATLNYQFWFRDPANTCSGSGFNFSNAWMVTWL